MPVIDYVKSFLRGPTPAAQLVEIETASGAVEQELTQHRARRPSEVVEAMKGNPDARARVEAIDAAIAAATSRLRDLRDAEGEVRRRIAVDATAARRRETEARPQRIATLRRERMKLAQTAVEGMAAAAAAMKALAANGAAMAAELDNEPSRRFFSFYAFATRFRSTVARLFVIDPGRELVADNSLLGITSHEKGERSHWTIERHETEGMDDLAPFFEDAAEAEAARERLAARKADVIVLPLPGGIWTLVRAENAYGDRQAAEQAAARATAPGKTMAILGHAGGFVVVPERFAYGAA